MHSFEYTEDSERLLTPEIVRLLNTLFEHRGRQQLFVEAKKDELATLVEVAKSVGYLSARKVPKAERVKLLIKNTVGRISKKEIQERWPDISTKTVARALADLVKLGCIRKVGASSATGYVWSDGMVGTDGA